jgi:hypothetical protein
MSDIPAHAADRELKRGSAGLPILAFSDARRRHGYELSSRIQARSGGVLRGRRCLEAVHRATGDERA